MAGSPPEHMTQPRERWKGVPAFQDAREKDSGGTQPTRSGPAGTGLWGHRPGLCGPPYSNPAQAAPTKAPPGPGCTRAPALHPPSSSSLSPLSLLLPSLPLLPLSLSLSLSPLPSLSLPPPSLPSSSLPSLSPSLLHWSTRGPEVPAGPAPAQPRPPPVGTAQGFTVPLQAPQPGRPLAPHALPLTPAWPRPSHRRRRRQGGRLLRGPGPGAEPGHCRVIWAAPPPPSCRPQTGPCCGGRAGSGRPAPRRAEPTVGREWPAGRRLQGLERRPRCLFSCRRRRRPRVCAAAVRAQPCPALGSGCSEWGFSVGGSGPLGQSPQAGPGCLSASTPARASVRKRHRPRSTPRAGAGGAGGLRAREGGGPRLGGASAWSGAAAPRLPG